MKRIKLKYKLPKTLCYYCENELAETWDHVFPRVHGGEDTLDNLVPACKRCNSLAGAKIFFNVDDKKAYLQKRKWLVSRFLSHRDRKRYYKKTKKEIDIYNLPVAKERPGVPEVTEVRWIVPTSDFHVKFLPKQVAKIEAPAPVVIQQEDPPEVDQFRERFCDWESSSWRLISAYRRPRFNQLEGRRTWDRN